MNHENIISVQYVVHCTEEHLCTQISHLDLPQVLLRYDFQHVALVDKVVGEVLDGQTFIKGLEEGFQFDAQTFLLPVLEVVFAHPEQNEAQVLRLQAGYVVAQVVPH